MNVPTFGPTGVQNVHDDQGPAHVMVRVDFQLSRDELFAALVYGFTETNPDRDPDGMSLAAIRHDVEAYLAASANVALTEAIEQVEAGEYTGAQLRRLDALRRAMERAYPVGEGTHAASTPEFAAEFPHVAAHLARERGQDTVTVDTGDHGPVTLPEPFWCLGNHDGEPYREDIVHEGEEHPLLVETPCHGEVRIAAACLVQRPLSPTDPQVRAAVEFDELHEYDSAELAGLADALVAYAVGPLHQLIERLQLLEGES